jgi:glycosyltransferase involved in cell wall biosynthesis
MADEAFGQATLTPATANGKPTSEAPPKKIDPLPMRVHGMAWRYLLGYRGIEIGASCHNSFQIPETTFVDYCDEAEDNEWHAVDEGLAGERHRVDVVAEADDLPFADSSQDFVLTSHVIEHLPNAVKAVGEWARVVRPGGILFIVIPHIEGWASHPSDKGKAPTPLEHFQEDFDNNCTVETHPTEEGVEKRGHLHRWEYDGFKKFIKHFFSGVLEHIDGEEIDQKCNAGHTHVLRVVKPTEDGSPRVDLLPTRKRFWVNWPDTTGCCLYRAGLPMLHLAQEMSEQGIDLNSGGNVGGVPMDASHDAYFFQRSSPPDILNYLHWIKKSKRLLVWDMDDNFFEIPQWSPAHRTVRDDGSLRTLPACLDLVDFITVSNESLKRQLLERLEELEGKIHVLPNLVDHTRYQMVPPRPDRRTRIMWTGSSFHGADLELLVPVIERIVAETDWEFIFVGAMTQKVRHLPPDRVWSIGGADIRYYPNLLCELSPDVALIPITGSRFDECKSAIKWMECSLAGAAVVATDFGPYREAIEHGRTGILIENDTDAWMDGIRTALDNRATLNAEARETVIAEHSWVSPARNLWRDFYVKVADAIQ